MNTAMGAGALAAAWGTWKIATGIWGLITAGAALNAAAVSLQAAAVSLGAAGGAGAVGGGGKTKRTGGFWGMLLTASPWIAAVLSAGDTPDNSYRNASEEEQARMRQEAREAAEAYNLRRYGSPSGPDDEARNKQAETDREQSLDSFLAGPPKPLVSEADIYRRAIEHLPPVNAAPPEGAEVAVPDTPARAFPDIPASPPQAPQPVSGREAEDASMLALRADPNGITDAIDEALAEAQARAAQAGQTMQEVLSVNATPTVNTSAIDGAIEKARELLSLLRQSGEAAVSARASADAELRRTFSDYGVAP